MHRGVPLASVDSPHRGCSWELVREGGRGHALRNHEGLWLQAVPPVDGEQAVFAEEGRGRGEVWLIEPFSSFSGAVAAIEGAVF